MKQKLLRWKNYILPFTVGVLIYALITNFDTTSVMFSGIFGWISAMFGRFFIGFGIAYVLDFMVKPLSKKLKMPRALAITISYLLLIGLVAWMFIYIIPMVVDTLKTIDYTAFYTQIRGFLNSTYLSLEPEVITFLNDTITKLFSGIINVFKNISIGSFVNSTISTVMDIFFGLLISFYALVEKKALLRHCKRLLAAIIPEKSLNQSLAFANEANAVFSKYLIGKLIDSLIVGILSVILYSVFGIHIAPFLAIVAAITNMIPYFGPVIGGVITAIILLCVNPIEAVYAIIIIVVLQTIDGMILGPKIIGDSVGISPLLTIIAITLGGNIAGFLGMFVGVPLLAVLKSFVYDRFIEKRIQIMDRKRENEAVFGPNLQPIEPAPSLDDEPPPKK